MNANKSIQNTKTFNIYQIVIIKLFKTNAFITLNTQQLYHRNSINAVKVNV